MSLIWVEVKNNQFVDLETQQTLKLHDYPMYAARSEDMAVPPQHEGKVMLVAGERSGEHIYTAKIRASLTRQRH